MKTPQTCRARRTTLPTAILALVAFVSQVCVASVTAGEIVFDTFGPGDSYDGDFRYSAGQSFYFETSESGPLATITVALGRTSNDVTATSFALLEEVQPNSFVVLETWLIPNETPALPAAGMVVSFDSILQPELQLGHAYLLGMGDTSPFGSLWFFNDQGILGTRMGGVPGTILLPAFRVEIVPEPSAASLFVVGVVLMLAPLRAGRFSGGFSAATAATILRSITRAMRRFGRGI